MSTQHHNRNPPELVKLTGLLIRDVQVIEAGRTTPIHRTNPIQLEALIEGYRLRAGLNQEES